VLREAGLLSERREGTRRLYRARPDGLAELRSFLAALWPDALERMKARAEGGASIDSPGAGTPPGTTASDRANEP
jgi:hypothetical protein